MARDLSEQERAFIEALAADTGRDLPAWMEAIAASGHAGRNEIIDWLRHQGFTFSNASWLERIHHNGGRLIYAGTDTTRTIIVERSPPARAARPAQAAATEPIAPAKQHAKIEAGAPTEAPEAAEAAALPATLIEPPPPPVTAAPPVTSLPQAATAQLPPGPVDASDAEIATLLLAAKGLRPLADFILQHIDQAVPALVRVASPPFVTLASPMPFAALLPGPKEVRLFADFGPRSRDRARKADTARFQPPFPDVIVLNDARQLDNRFRELVETAYTRALK